MKTFLLVTTLACLFAGAAAAANPASSKGSSSKKHGSSVCSAVKLPSCKMCEYVSDACGAASQADLDALAARLDAKIADLEAADAAARAAQARLNDMLTSYRSTKVTVDVSDDGAVSCTRRDSDFPQPLCLLDPLTGTLDITIDCGSGFLYAGQVICNSDMRSPAWPLTQVGSVMNTAYCSLIPPDPLPKGEGVAELTIGCQYDVRLLQP